MDAIATDRLMSAAKVISYGHTGGFSWMTNQAFYYPATGHVLVVLLHRSGPPVGPVVSEANRAVAAMTTASR